MRKMKSHQKSKFLNGAEIDRAVEQAVLEALEEHRKRKNSVATWDGDTLVVKVTALNDQSWLDRAGNFHSDMMTVVERYTPTSAVTMRYEAEITDAETYTKPWKMEMTLYKAVGPDVTLGQFKCVEHVTELLYGDLRKEPLK